MARIRKTRSKPLQLPHTLDPANVPFNAELARDVADNPYKAGEKIPVTRSLRNDQLAGFYSRAQIDQAQYAAGRKWQAYHEAAGVGQIIAIDPLKEPVDGRGAAIADFTDAQLHAFNKLMQARTMLGAEGYAIVSEVLGEGLQIVEVAMRRGFFEQFNVRYYGQRFRECLETLAKGWGLVRNIVGQK